MTTWIALFRGINVGGNHILPMKLLVKLLEDSGCKDVRTYIQSGNAVFRRRGKDAARLSKAIAKSIADRCGFEASVFLFRLEEMEKLAAANPFPQGTGQPERLFFWFLAEKPRSPDLAALEALRSRSERFALQGKLFVLHAPDGVGRSKLAAKVERFLGVDLTARNWRTLERVRDLARGIARETEAG